MLKDCEELYTRVMKEQTTRDYSTKLSVMKDRFMTEEEGANSGGIMLYAQEGKIVCSNTLEDRLNMAFEMELPRIRHGLFPKPLA